jgi:hypothetical protein
MSPAEYIELIIVAREGATMHGMSFSRHERIYADVRLSPSEFDRGEVSTRKQQGALLQTIKETVNG